MTLFDVASAGRMLMLRVSSSPRRSEILSFSISIFVTGTNTST